MAQPTTIDLSEAQGAPQVSPASQRSRSFLWTDPAIGLEASKGLSGLEYLKAVADGVLPVPPLLAALGFDRTPPQVELGAVTFFFEPSEYHYNSIGSVHGGVLSALLDTSMGCAVHSLLPAGAAYTTLELSVRFLRPVTIRTGSLRCEGTVLSSGRKVATAEGKLRDERGKLFAHATTTCMILNAAAPEAAST